MDGSDSSSNRQKDTLAVINDFYRGLISVRLLLVCSWGLSPHSETLAYPLQLLLLNGA
jgi:hypothetical protein